MKAKAYLLGVALIIFTTACQQSKVKVDTIHGDMKELKTLTLGEIKPNGWIYKQMKTDLEEGYVGHLDELVPDLILEDDIYGKDRLTNKIKSKDVGAIGVGEWTTQILWWNSETQSNWRDGWLRHAYLLENEEYIAKAKQFVDRMISYQDEDGYMGIYAEDLRYNFEGENGELWAQSSLFRILLAYYELTGDKEVFDAVEKAMQFTMSQYPIYQSDPFNVSKPYAGVGHGLTIVDVLDKLHQLTHKEEYRDYAIWLYDDYNKYELSEVDIHLKNLANENYKFKGHGVHTYEHLRALVIASYGSKDNKYMKALDAYLNKLNKYLTPSGAPIGDEFIFERYADASETGYEYCSLQELLDSYSFLLQKSGDLKWADRIEWLFYNAAQGARHPHEHSIAYLKTDNSYTMTGSLHPGKEDVHKDNTRYTYSPTHRKAAVCCVPNAGRIGPYFLSNMWLKSSSGLVKSIYGPSKLNAEINGEKIEIIESTNYPYELESTYQFKLDKPVQFKMTFRKPDWCTEMSVMVNDKIYQGNQIEKEWQNGDVVKLAFKTQVKRHVDLKGESYFTHGPLLYALPLESTEEVTKQFDLDRFRNVSYTNNQQNKIAWKLVNDGNASFQMHENTKDFKNQGRINIELINPENQEKIDVELVPLAGTILRKVTFQNL
ncbi:beta-L-arabinofuranosidase domain-containing protein [Marinifilum caeruleilacunae]|uniref:Glycosyl hydrolase n=1 Tax=Marinifilum caeruleilacunae TaxID=2499076 RepID=A0ABX1WQQ5_9BACT|nr:beta-L-arabinofuranosidase domain-containing protein [Marinifilum caeruleilacunae]NOU58371.1 glycosyl hydrolase [Marinifilum caeruleilacunae]